MATNECVTKLQSIQLRALDLGMLECKQSIIVYNDNQACVQWSASMTSKGIKYLNLRENQVRECHQDKIVQVLHILGIINPSDIFTKEMRDGAHFCRLRDCMMASKNAFLMYHHNVPADIIAAEFILPY